MADIYFSYPNIQSQSPPCLEAYMNLLVLLTGSPEEYHQAMTLLFADHPPELLPNGKFHEALIWETQYFGSKSINLWLEDEELVVESAWDVPFEFYLHLYAYLWKLDPYVCLHASFMGNDEGVAHWI